MSLIILICICKHDLTVDTCRLTSESWYSLFYGFLFVFPVICYEDNLQLILCGHLLQMFIVPFCCYSNGSIVPIIRIFPLFLFYVSFSKRKEKKIFLKKEMNINKNKHLWKVLRHKCLITTKLKSQWYIFLSWTYSDLYLREEVNRICIVKFLRQFAWKKKTMLLMK